MIKGAENLFTKQDIKRGANRGASNSFFSFSKVDEITGQTNELKTVG